MPDRVPIGVVGLGRMGKRHVSTLLYRVPMAQVVAVCSTLPNEVEWAGRNEEYRAFGIKAYANYTEMLGHPGLKAVIIATSTDVHACQTREAIHRGMHVLCEKPLSIDLAEVQSIIELANEHPELKVMVGFTRRFDPSYRDAYEKIFQDKAIGTPYMVRSNTTDLLNPDGFFIRYVTRNGGMFVDCAIHDIDVALWFLQDPVPKACWAVGTVQHHPELKEFKDVDNGLGVVEFWNGSIGYFYISRTQAHGFDVTSEITATEGKIAVNLIPRHNENIICDKLGVRHEVQPEYWDRFKESFAIQSLEYVDCIVHDRPVPLPMEVSAKVMLIAMALQEAQQTGDVQRFDKKGEWLRK